jgi:hypothetical protein
LIRDTKGNIYGTTVEGGSGESGTGNFPNSGYGVVNKQGHPTYSRARTKK